MYLYIVYVKKEIYQECIIVKDNRVKFLKVNVVKFDTVIETLGFV